MGLDIATGAVSATPDPVHPLDASATPGVQRPAQVQPGQLSGPTQAAYMPLYSDQVAGDEAACQAAMHAGMDARNAMLGHYQGQALPLGGSIGDVMDLPPVPANAVPAEGSDLYPWSGLEPTPADVGFYHAGNEPLPE